MKKYLLYLLLCIALITPSITLADNPPIESNSEAAQILPEVIAAAKLSELTGIALNPLLVGGTMRAWDYWQAPEAQRSSLHWSAQPWFWGTLLSIGLLFLANNTIGRIFPPTAKAMDAVESLEGKVAPLYTAPLLIPVGIQVVQALESSSILPAAHASTLSTSPEILLNPLAADPLTITLGTMLALFVMGVIWLTNQAIHALVLICPFGIVSMILRSAQLGLIALLLLATAIHPVLGALLALLIIFVCARIAGWSFRLMVFGTVLAWDLCLFRRQQSAKERVMVFSGSGIKLPARTLGFVSHAQQQTRMSYRPWLILPKREIILPAQDRQLTHGVLFSQVHQLSPQGEMTLFTLPPRYRGSEAELMSALQCEFEQASKIKSGLNAAMEWIKGQKHSSTSS